MSTSMETWVDTFQFSEDLKALELAYQEQHHQSLQLQAIQDKPKLQIAPTREPIVEDPDTASSDEIFLDTLSEKIAARLADSLLASDLFSKGPRAEELEKDNALMAKQIETLLKRLNSLDFENQSLCHELLQYKPVVGSFYKRHR